MSDADAEPLTGLILTGGGARAAYQVGVLKGIAEMLPPGAPSPFPVITGTSAGAVSAVVLAQMASRFSRAVRAIEHVWRQFSVDQVFKASPGSMLRSGLHWMLSLMTGGWGISSPRAMFDNAPLWDLLRRHLDFDGIARSVHRGHLHAVGICATCYADAESVTFFQSRPDLPQWQRAFRRGMRTQLTLEHLMASLAIPFMFRPVRVQDSFFGDGAMRQTAPLSAALHLGAQRLLIIGVREPRGETPAPLNRLREPTFGQVFGFMLDTLFMDQIVADLERLNSMNDGIPSAGVVERHTRQVDSLIFMPSRPICDIARRHRKELPFTLRALLRVMGADDASGQQLMSYLLFQRAFTRELIQLGYEDCVARAQEVRDFLRIPRRRKFRTRARVALPV